MVEAALSAVVDGGVRQGLANRGTRTLRWIETGSGDPVVVAGAGTGEPGSLAWAGVLRELAGTARVVAYDRAGLGASDPVAELSLEQELDDLTAVAAAVGEQPCVLVDGFAPPARARWSPHVATRSGTPTAPARRRLTELRL